MTWNSHKDEHDCSKIILFSFSLLEFYLIYYLILIKKNNKIHNVILNCLLMFIL
jgi:hypothetical protein